MCIRDRCDSSSAKFQAEEAGTVDMIGSESDILAQIHRLITWLPANNEDDASYEECTDDLNRVCADLDLSLIHISCVLSGHRRGRDHRQAEASGYLLPAAL